MIKESSSTTLTRASERVRPRGGPPRPGRGVLGGTNSGDPTPLGPDRSGNQTVERGATRSGPGGGLPLAVDCFLGREEDLRGIEELFEKGRLVTISGAPGMGKTRLATELARAAPKDRYPNGRWLVPLAPVASFELVAPALAKAMGVPEQGQSDIVDGLVRHIDTNHLLIVLDNCEHLLDAAARLVAALVESCPNVTILATSQERLGVPGEQVWALRGLDVPSGETVSMAAATASPAVRLFAERAQAVHRDFDLTADVTGPVVEICRRLDGMPLAIELAASRVGTMAVAEIAAHLDERFALLTGGARTVLPRHQTLRAALEWAYDLLTDAEQAVLRRLSVFAGGATADAVERVVAGEPVEAGTSLELLTHLVARSLVVAEGSGSATPGHTRYRLLESIRHYGRDRLAEAGEANATAVRHLDWCIELAEEAERHLTGPNQVPWLDRLDADHDNLRAALAHALDHGSAEKALRLAGSLALFWRIRGHFRDGLNWLDRAAKVSEGLAEPIRAKAYWGFSLIAAVTGHWIPSARAAQTSLNLYRRLDNPSGAARALLILGTFPRRDTSRVIDDLRQAIAVARQADDRWCLAYALAACGTTFSRAGESMARSVLEEAVAVASDVGDPECLLYARISLGEVLLLEGDLTQAEAILDTVLAGRGPSNPYDRASARIARGRVALNRGDRDQAQMILNQVADDLARTFPSGPKIHALCLQADVHMASGDLDAAHLCFERASDFSRSRDLIMTSATVGLGRVALARGDGREAARLFEEVREAVAASGDRRLAGDAFQGLASVAVAAGDHSRAADFAQRAVALRVEAGDRMGMADALELSACVQARVGREAKAVRLLGAVDADRRERGYVRATPPAVDVATVMAAVKRSLGAKAFAAAWDQGRDTALEEAVAGSRSRKGRPRRDRPATGVEALSDSELAVARLVLEGLTNPEVAARLFLSPHTVKSHLRSVYAKLGMTTRRDLRDRFKDVGI